MSNNNPEARIPDADLHRIASDALDKCPKEIPEGEIAGRWKHGYITGAKDELIRHLSSQPSSGLREQMWTRQQIQEAHDRYMIYMGSGALPMPYGEWLDKNFQQEETPSAQTIEGDAEQWHPQDYSGKNHAEAQPIADSKEVPASKPHPEDVKEVERYIRNVLNAVLLNSEAIKFVEAAGALKDVDRIGKELATWFTSFWSAMDEGAEQWKADYENAKAHLAAKETQIAGLLESNKEWGEKYLAINAEADGYMKALEDIASGKLLPRLIAQQVIEKFKSPTPKTDNP